MFTQFNRVGDPPDNLRPLPSKNIDTGMGLERIAATMQGVETNYHIDILKPIVLAAAEVCGRQYDSQSDDGRRLRRITDHVRACAFAVHENVYPGPNKEKYVIRRLLRRAVLDGHQMGLREPFLHRLVPVVAEMMRNPYPELGETIERVSQVIAKEEEAFFSTIDAGLNRIERILDDMRKENRIMVSGQEIMFMYGTHGFPPELFEQIAAERNLTFDWDGFRTLMEKNEDGPGKLFQSGPLDALIKAGHETEFLGYETTEAEGTVVGLIAQGHLVESVEEVGHEQPITVVLDRSPFYGESGGQVGDTGEIVGPGFRFDVTDTQRDRGLILHIGHLREGKIKQGAHADARVDAERRQGIRRAHSATHILHFALQKYLGKHAQQQGSKVDDDWLRFDFTNLEPVHAGALEEIEHEVTAKLTDAQPIRWQTVPLAEARAAGAMMLFGEKYPDPVRMVSMGEFSRELCGGIHLDNTRQVENFEILSEEGVSAGVRRVVALTGAKARDHHRQTTSAAEQTAELLEVSPDGLPHAVQRLSARVRELKKQLASGAAAPHPAATGPTREMPSAPYGQPVPGAEAPHDLKRSLEQAARALNVASLDVPDRVRGMLREIEDLEKRLTASEAAGGLSADELLAGAEEIAGVKIIVADTPGANPNMMRQLIDQLRRKGGAVAVLLGVGEDDKVTLVAGVSRDLVQRGCDAGRWVRETAAVVGGGGGGKPDMAQAGGKDPSKLPAALEKARAVIATMLQG